MVRWLSGPLSPTPLSAVTPAPTCAGPGKYTASNAGWWRGDFKNGWFQGPGTRVFADGSRFEGVFAFDERTSGLEVPDWLAKFEKVKTSKAWNVAKAVL